MSTTPDADAQDRELAARICSDVGFLADAEPYHTAKVAAAIAAHTRAAVERESGDLILSGAKVQAEIGEILANPSTTPSPQRILFKSVGLAIEDLTAARLVWQAKSQSST